MFVIANLIAVRHPPLYTGASMWTDGAATVPRRARAALRALLQLHARQTCVVNFLPTRLPAHRSFCSVHQLAAHIAEQPHIRPRRKRGDHPGQLDPALHLPSRTGPGLAHWLHRLHHTLGKLPLHPPPCMYNPGANTDFASCDSRPRSTRRATWSNRLGDARSLVVCMFSGGDGSLASIYCRMCVLL